MNLRALASALIGRARFGATGGVTFGGKRDLYKALGYSRVLLPTDYRDRYKRNAVAARIVEAFPKDMWRGGGELVEDEDDKIDTEFEKAWTALDERLHLWSVLQRADVLAGIGRYSILVLGAPGAMETPLESCAPEELFYLTPYAEEDAKIERLDINQESPRYGLPEFYTVTRTTQTTTGVNSNSIGKRVHWTRVFHIADGLLDDRVYGQPRLERCWNLIDDLEKVTGGGAEAYWKRADQGMQLDLDPTMDLEPAQEAALEAEVDEYTHGLKRIMHTRGVKVESLGSDVSDFKNPVDSIISQLSAGTGIPQRILMGSERGQLASTQDRSNWDERVAARRTEFGEQQVVRPFVNMLIGLGVLPEPKEYSVRWSQLRSLDDQQKAELAGKLAELNNKMGETVVAPDEIREKVLGYASLKDAGITPHQNPGPSGNPRAASRADVLTDADYAQAERLLTTLMAPGAVPSDLSVEIKELRESVLALAARPAPPVNVTVQAATQPNKRVERDGNGRALRLVNEPEETDGRV